MAVTTVIHAFDPNQVDNAAAETLFTSNATTGSITRGRAKFANTTGAADTVSVWAVPSGGSAGDTNALAKTKAVAANDYIEIDFELGANATLQAQAGSATTITASSVFAIEYLP